MKSRNPTSNIEKSPLSLGGEGKGEGGRKQKRSGRMLPRVASRYKKIPRSWDRKLQFIEEFFYTRSFIFLSLSCTTQCSGKLILIAAYRYFINGECDVF